MHFRIQLTPFISPNTLLSVGTFCVCIFGIRLRERFGLIIHGNLRKILLNFAGGQYQSSKYRGNGGNNRRNNNDPMNFFHVYSLLFR